MAKPKLDKDSRVSIITTVIILISYAAQRLIGFYIEPTKQFVILLAMFNTLLLLAVILILLKRTNVFYSLLAALIAFKMLPVGIPSLGQFSQDADILYYIVAKAAVVIFAFTAYKIYKSQEEPKAIKPLPVAAILLAVPFFSQIAAVLTDYFLNKTGSMLPGYISQYACYAAAALLILGLAYTSNYDTMRFAAYFEYAALTINIIRMAGKIVLLATTSQHISKSLYGWIIVYAALIIIYIIVKNIKKKKEC